MEKEYCAGMGLLPHTLLVDPDKKNELLEKLKDPHYFFDDEDEPLLFRPEYEAHLQEFLCHHALAERNQSLLFLPENERYLNFYIERWVLGSVFEAKLCEPEYRGRYLMKYIDFHNFADSNNEALLFAPGMEKYRRFYIEQTCFHSRSVEVKLFEPEYADDLEMYVRNRRSFYNDHLKAFEKAASPQLVEIYKSYH